MTRVTTIAEAQKVFDKWWVGDSHEMFPVLKSMNEEQKEQVKGDIWKEWLRMEKLKNPELK